jgi:mannose-6-phosphate isomerase
MLYPFLFRPIFQERIWGGRNLERLYHKALPPSAKIGESWEISDREDAQSVIANGPLAGKTLRWLMENHERELLGAARSLNGRFPLLVKILDAEEKLSLQVHPPPHKAPIFQGEPKTEMWYITDAQPGAELYVGLKPGATRSLFEAKIKSGTVADCFHRIPVHSGDAMFLPSGRVHAIGAGLVIFEIQQNSDTTFRVFDWNRTDSSGKQRQLHVAESLECIDFADFEPQVIRPSGEKQILVNDPLFQVEKLDLPRGKSHELSFRSAQVLAVTQGALRVGPDHVELGPGGFCLLPASLKNVQVDALAPTRLLLAVPGV